MSNAISVQYQYPVGIPVMVSSTSQCAQILGHTHNLLLDGDHGDNTPKYIIQLTEGDYSVHLMCEQEFYPAEHNEDCTDVKQYPSITRMYDENTLANVENEPGDVVIHDQDEFYLLYVIYSENDSNDLSYVLELINTSKLFVVPV